MPFLLNIILSPCSLLSFLLLSLSLPISFSLPLHTLLPATSRPSSMAPPSSANHISQPCIYGDACSSYVERKSHRFMKWLSRLFKRSGGHNGGRPGHFPQFLGDENMVWHAPDTSVDDRPKRTEKENEDLDHAITQTLSEDMKKPSRSAEDLRRQNGCRWRTEDNEDPAKGLQGDVNPPWYPPYQPPPQYYPSVDYKICGRCHRDIGCGNYLGCMGTFFHPECFCCRACSRPITEYEFSLSGMDPYHKSCFKELTHPKCEVCHQFIPTNGAGLIEYRCHPFWSQKYCPLHEHDDTARCCSCERLESWNTTYISLGDGRSLCLECVEYAVMDTGDCQQLYHEIRDFYEGLYMKLDQQIPMLLVERQALNEAIVGEKTGHRHMPETRGLCLSEEQTVSIIAKRPKIGDHRVVGMKTQPQRLIRKCEVTAILVLYGLPRLLTGAILAHELMHGWLRLNGFRDLTPEVEEGICQVLSHLWLESKVIPGSNRCTRVTRVASSSSPTSSKKGGTSDVEKKLGEFFMHQIANDASPAYGGGFRAANAAVNKYSLHCTIEHIRLTGNFPL